MTVTYTFDMCSRSAIGFARELVTPMIKVRLLASCTASPFLARNLHKRWHACRKQHFNLHVSITHVDSI